MTEARPRTGWAPVPIVALVLVAIATLLLLGINYVRGATTCAWDTSDCAYSSQKTGYYAGKLHLTGHPRTVNVEFGSRDGLRPIPLHLDDAGRYCLVWASERSVDVAVVGRGRRLTEAGAPGASLAQWRAFGTAGPPAGCQRVAAGIPWDRQSGLQRAWQYLLLIVVAILGLGLLLCGRVAGRAGSLAFSAAVLALVANAALSFTIWT